MKYIDAEKLKAEIERHIKHYEKLNRNEFKNGELYICQELLSFIDSLQQEQTEVDLKNEIITQWSKCNPTDEGMGSEYAIITVEQFDAIAHHFYELRLNARKEE